MKNNLNDIIYLDNAAALKPDPRVIDFFNKNINNCYFNQEAIHSAAYDLRNKICDAEEKLISFFSNQKMHNFESKKNKLKVLWSDSGTSAINTFFSSPFFDEGNIVITNLEHASISEGIRSASNCEIRTWNNSLKYQKKSSNSGDLFDVKMLEKLVDNDTKAVVIHHVHSELGYIENLYEIGKVVKNLNPNTFVFIDSIQGVTKLPIAKELFDDNFIDAITISGYKTGSFGGAAIVYRDVAESLFSKFFKTLRTSNHSISRPNPIEILCLVNSIELLINEIEDNYKKISNYKDFLYQELQKITLFNKQKITFLIDQKNCTPYILYFVLPEIQGAVILRMLAAENIYISSGSACEAETNEVSKTLQALAVPKEFYYGALRVSFSSKTTMEEIELFIQKFKNCLENY